VCRTAGALFEALQKKASAVSSNQSGRLEIDVLVMAVEASLWIGEQFASDLQVSLLELSLSLLLVMRRRFCLARPLRGRQRCNATLLRVCNMESTLETSSHPA
jgi:hypothetical protein